MTDFLTVSLTSDYAISAYLPKFVIINKNDLILLAFVSSITFIASLATLERPSVFAVPPELARRYEARLAQRNVMAEQRLHDHQWLRQYLDFSHKYSAGGGFSC